jgi:flavin-binding protein dodecin
VRDRGASDPPKIPDRRAKLCGQRCLKRRNYYMAKVLKVIELLAQSEKSWEDAAQGAVKEASKTLRNIRSIYIKEFEASVEGGKIQQYRVNAKVSFDLEADRARK